ncbi:MAG: N-acetylmuramic acid 6-phosphate etherase [Proteobacteria bacterium]|nr:N-acetylmuramic acid 6-phosphate etherase [Pseudomonadota bacterium]
MPDESPTERVLDASRHLDQMSVEDALATIHREDRRAYDAVGAVLPDIARAVDALVCCLGEGGRWFNVGAGTSGRLGVLDASEVPPTFGMPTQCVQGIIAGGERALVQAIEGAEDDAAAAEEALGQRELRAGDAVLAISASGSTPFALGALDTAKRVGARRLALTCHPASALAREAEIAIAPKVGPEVIAGSTRMKGGLAQKMVLHLLSTVVMVQLGRVEGNLMTNLTPVSAKLARRAVRILTTLAECDEKRARELLAAHDGNVADALRAIRDESG